MGEVTKIDRSIRGLDQELYREAKAEAAKLGITIGDWMNEAMAEKLARKGAVKK
jgi:hypothetical protein